jgi:hypothetical protein
MVGMGGEATKQDDDLRGVEVVEEEGVGDDVGMGKVGGQDVAHQGGESLRLGGAGRGVLESNGAAIKEDEVEGHSVMGCELGKGQGNIAAAAGDVKKGEAVAPKGLGEV